MTATLSDDGAHVSERLVRVTPDTVRPVGCDGGVVSAGEGGGGAGVGVAQAAVAALARAGPEALPAASRATTSYWYVVPHVRPDCEEVVDVTDATFDEFRYTSYAVTPTLSVEADHWRVMAV